MHTHYNLTGHAHTKLPKKQRNIYENYTTRVSGYHHLSVHNLLQK